MNGHKVLAWRGVPIYPCGKIPVSDVHTRLSRVRASSGSGATYAGSRRSAMTPYADQVQGEAGNQIRPIRLSRRTSQ
ncbi:hypothetical protein AB0H43_21005 [Hamadaea sp. NPDC050747]|uniref:hypothetical protein n=1 Tax=Hamadaea sp. NPDC050747 TaxID=3155789 RepID=UPI00340D5ACE